MPDKLPAAFAWALKSRDLESAFRDAGPSSALSVNFSGTKEPVDRLAIHAHWTPGRHNEFGGNLNVWVFPVLASERHGIRTVLLNEGLAQIVAWVKAIFDAPPTWRDLPHYRRWWVENGAVHHRDE